MKPYMIPFSTAVWDPKWYHQDKHQQWHFIDKNGVLNGARAESLVPGPTCEGLCRGPERCSSKDPNSCPFLKAYYQQLNKLDFTNLIDKIHLSAAMVQNELKFTEEPIVILIFHEIPTNPCSERWMVQKWFKENGYELEEFTRDNN